MEKEKTTYKLPEGWKLVKIDEISIPVVKTNKNKNDITGNFYYIDINSIDNKSFRIANPQKYNWNTAPSRAQQIIKTNNILFATVRPYLRNIALVNEKYNNHICSSAFCVIQPITVNSKYIYYYILSNEFIQSVNKLAKGTSYPAVTSRIVFNQVIPLAPLEEQQKIVFKIESLCSELEHAEKGLLKAKQQLEVYRQALLKSAFEGKLTEDWRKENNQEPTEQLLKQIKEERQKCYTKEIADWTEVFKQWEKDGKKGKKPQKPSNNSKVNPLSKNELSKLFPLPQTAQWIKIGDITLRTEYGSSAKSNKVGKIPVLRMGNIQNGKFDWTSLVYTTNNDEIIQYQLSHNDILFNRTNSSELVGKTAIYKGERPAIFAGYLIRINQIKSLCNADFLNYFLNSQTAKNHGQLVKSDSVNQSNINAEKLKNYPLPYYSIEEQNKIVEVLDNKFSITERIQDTIEISLKKLKVLYQSILKKAFDGKLVEPLPYDRPTDNLLNQIKAEKKKFLEEQNNIKKIALKKPKKMEKSLSIEDVLKSSDKPMLAKKVWQESKHNEDIAAFYAELKELSDKIVEIKDGLNSFLKLKK